MKVSDQGPWVQRRSKRHDEMCAAIVVRKERIFPGFTGEVRARVEVPCGRGFCDVVAMTDAPPEDRDVAIIEVKTNVEVFSAGDLIRQLKWYQQHIRLPRGVRRQDIRLITVLEDELLAPNVATFLQLLTNENIEALPIGYFEIENWAQPTPYLEAAE